MPRRLLAVGQAVGRPFLAGTNRLEGRRRRADAVGRADCHGGGGSGAGGHHLQLPRLQGQHHHLVVRQQQHR